MGQSRGYVESVSGAADGIAVLRHELANVLNGLTGMTQLLKSSGLGPEQACWLDAIESSAEQMGYLLQHAGSGNGLTAPGEALRINGQRVLEQVMTAHAPAAAAKGLRLILTVAADLPVYWRSDARLLRQLLDNLLDNALKFTDTGDVLVQLRPVDGHGLQLSVHDTGPGIQDSDRLRVFGIRERGANSPNRPGSGLGLSICKRISAELAGEIEYRPGREGGSVFTVLLPRILERDGGYQRTISAFGEVRCLLDLDLDPRLRRSLACFLDRLGIAWSKRAKARECPVDDGLVVAITGASRAPGEPWPGVWLKPSGFPARQQPVLLSPPILESALERALLRLALYRRWQRLNPGGTRD